MKQNKLILVLLCLICLTVSSFTLAKFFDEKEYVIQVTDKKFDQMAPPETEEPVISLEEEVNTLWFADGFYDLTFARNGIYGIQLYGGKGAHQAYDNISWLSPGGQAGYLAGYVEINKSNQTAWQFQLANSGYAEAGAIGGLGGGENGTQFNQGYNGGGASVVTRAGQIRLVAGGGGGGGNSYDYREALGGNAGSMLGKSKDEIDSSVTTGEFIGTDGLGQANSGGSGSALVAGDERINANGREVDGKYGGGGGAGHPRTGEGGFSYDANGLVGSGGGGGSSYMDSSQFKPIYPNSVLSMMLEGVTSDQHEDVKGRIVVIYLGPKSALPQIEELNQQ